MPVSDEVTAMAQVRSRRLFITDRRRFNEAVAELDDRWDYEVVVRRLHANRSQQANRYYWGVVVGLLSDHTGFTPDEMHDWLKMRFIPKKLAVCDSNGEIKGEFVLGGSTRKMSIAQFGEYIEDIRRWAAQEIDVLIPDADGGLVRSIEGYGFGV